MAVRFYDDALLEKFQRWTKDTQVTLTSVNETKRMFETIIDNKNDNPIKFPMITLSRPGGYSIETKGKQPLSHNGLTFVQNIERGAKLNAIPISIQYQIDIYTRYLDEADEYARNIVFNIINYPVLEIEIPYEGKNYRHKSNIRLISDVEDNSDIAERLISGQFTRLTLGINIDDAYLWDVRIRDNISIVEGRVEAISPPPFNNVLDKELLFKTYND